jgi:predicted ArsR family transcriptional regulator
MTRHRSPPSDRIEVRDLIMELLAKTGPLSVVEIGERLGLSANKVGGCVRRYASYLERTDDKRVRVHRHLAGAA